MNQQPFNKFYKIKTTTRNRPKGVKLISIIGGSLYRHVHM